MTNTQITRSSRSAYEDFIQQRDKDLCDIVAEYGLTVAVALTSWTKPTIIKALEKYRPDLLKGRQRSAVSK